MYVQVVFAHYSPKTAVWVLLLSSRWVESLGPRVVFSRTCLGVTVWDYIVYIESCIGVDAAGMCVGSVQCRLFPSE